MYDSGASREREPKISYKTGQFHSVIVHNRVHNLLPLMPLEQYIRQSILWQSKRKQIREKEKRKSVTHPFIWSAS